MYIILYYIPCACFRRRPRNRPQRSFGQIVVFTMTFPAISKTKNHRRGNIISYYCFYIVAQKRYIPLYIFPRFTTATSKLDNKSHFGVV